MQFQRLKLHQFYTCCIFKYFSEPLQLKNCASAFHFIARMPTTTSSPLKSRLLNFSENQNNEKKDGVLQLEENVSTATSMKRKLSLNSCDNEIEEGKTITISKKEKCDRPFTVSVEGNIGCGKSTFLKHFESFPNVTTFQEPIDKWINLNGSNLLGKLYEGGDRWCFLFQSYVQLTRLQIHLEKPDTNVKLIERSFHNNRFCFLESDLEDGSLSEAEYLVLCEYFNVIEKHMDIGVDLIVYIRTSPNVVFERMKKRGRVEEANVPLKYIEKIHKYYERWLIEHLPRAPHAPVLIIDGDEDLESVFTQCQKDLPVILGKKPMCKR